MADDIVIGSVAVDIVPDTRRLRPELQAKVRDLSVDVDVRADTAGLRTELDDVTRPRDVTVTANADTTVAGIQLDEVARDRTANIRANVDRSGLDDVGKAAGNMGLLASSAITLGPALIPIAASLAAIGLALGAPLAIAGGGATLFGFLVGFAVKDTNEQLKAIDKQRQKLAGLTKGTKEYKAAQADLKVLVSGLTPGQKQYADALDRVKGSFGTLLGGDVGTKLLNPVSQFLNLTADVLPKLTPIIVGVSDALSTLLGDLDSATHGPGFRDFVRTLGQDVGPDLVQFGHIAGNVFQGLGGLLLSFNDTLGGPVLRGLGRITDRFADFGENADKSQKLQDFIGYVRDVGPQVGDTLTAVGRAISHIVEALAPLGVPTLKVVEGIADAISGIPIPVLTAIAGATAGLVAVSKVGKLGGSIGGLFKGSLFGADRGASPARPLYVLDVKDGPGLGLLDRLGPLKYLPQAVLLAATAFETVKATQGIIHNLSQAPKGFGFGAPTLGSSRPSSGAHIDYGQLAINANGLSLTSTTDHADALQASLGKASRTIDLIGPHADIAFGQASKDVRVFAADIDRIRDKRLRVILDDLAAEQSLKALQALRLQDKTLTITVRQELERVVGPGGGQGRPTGAAGASAPRAASQPAPQRSHSGSGGSGPLVNIEHMQAHDYNDFLRQSQNRAIAQAGGGVLL